MPRVVYKKKSKRGNLKAYEHHRAMVLDQVSRLYLQGKTQWEIAQSFNPPVTQKCISERLAEVRKRWRDSTLMNFDERKDQELAKIDRLEAEAYEAWARSKEIAETNRRVITKGLRKSDDEEFKMTVTNVLKDRTAKGQVGNPAFLAQVERCIEMRCRIFGVTKPGDVHLNQTNNTVNVSGPKWEDLFAAPSPGDPVESKLAEVERLALPVKVETKE